FIEQFGLSGYDAEVLTSGHELANYFEDCLKDYKHPKQAANWIMGSLLGLLNAESKTIDQSPISASDLANLLKLIDEGVISGKIAKTVFDDMAKTGKPPKQIVEEKGLVQVTDTGAIEEVVLNIIAKNPKQVEQYKNGKDTLFGFFVGQVMKETKGKANPKAVNEILKAKLSA
ncbi:MAG TPA: Asp-tRNA(Asn)/Glu-tRNA(Gln) amidotransferase GatCAB subunit B, partial [Desulfobacteraceae bacterium]|nr:Asp-tRNA(Asn)/Glu-tRNA(Gln) amidotransferase GatCAB subunit B [Desulfobacteraceae bacterium]